MVSRSSPCSYLATHPLTISVLGGFGLYDGLAATGAVLFDYDVANQPIVIQPYARTILFFDASGAGNASYLMSIGAMINYSF